METTRSTTQKEKHPLLSKVRTNPKYPLNILLASILFILLFCACLLAIFNFGLDYIRDNAYTYSDDTYDKIEVAIKGGEIMDADGNKVELTGCIQKGIGIDALELQKHVDKFTMTYENDETMLVCTIKDGYFSAEVTTIISSDYTITKMARNYNSLGEYMEHIFRLFGIAVLGTALLLFFVLLVIIFGGLSLYGVIANRLANSKKKGEKKAPAQTALALDSLAVETNTP